MASINPDMKIKLENTLTLNLQMQSQLIVMKGRLEKLLTNVKNSYKINELLLRNDIARRKKTGVGIAGAYLKGGTFYLKGNMFFKDINCRNCPNNPDYDSRKLENEMFPMDLNLKSRHVWSTQDKQRMVLGIKEQIIDYLEQSKSDKNKNKKLYDEKLAKLLCMIPKSFRIDWDDISSSNLFHRHTANSCEAIWNSFLHPSLIRTAWSKEENQKLLEAASKFSFQNWSAIANEVGKRSDFQCYVQFQTYVCYMLPESTTKWTKEEDERLLKVISKNNSSGVINWSNVNAHFPRKAKTTLISRYTYTLNSAIKLGCPFTPEEDLLLIAAVKEYGGKFNCIPRTLFPNRSLVQLRAHYKNVLCKRHNKRPWTLEDDLKLMDFVTANGAKEWKQCEISFNGKHSRTSCRTRFLTIKKNLEKNPDSSIENLKRLRLKGRSANKISIENWKEKIEEFSKNSNDDECKSKVEIMKPTKIRQTNKEVNVKKPRKDAVKKPRKVTVKKPRKVTLKKSEVENELNEDIPKREGKIPSVAEVKPLLETETPNEIQINQEVISNVKISSTERTVKGSQVKRPYLERLRANGIRKYNFFKYAYNIKMHQHPCDNIEIVNDDFATTMSSLNLQTSFLPEYYDFDSSIPEHVKLGVRSNSLQLINSGDKVQLLPPNWSTAMGFRSLCIHTASISSLQMKQSINVCKNPYIELFRQRLRTLFYSTALLSRLNPGMVGIPPIENEKPTIKRKRSTHKKVNDETNKTKKIKHIGEFSENIKTEYET